MGYLRTELFDSASEWNDISSAVAFYDLVETGWEELLSTPDKSSALMLQFHFSESFVSGQSISKTYSTPFFFSFQDYYGNTMTYEEIIVSMMVRKCPSDASIAYTHPDKFYLSMSLWNGSVKLSEWFVPAEDSANSFKSYCFDLQPLIDAGYDRFDTIRFDILSHPGSRRLIFGEAFLYQNQVEHNMITSMMELLHLKIIHPRGVLVNAVSTGDTAVLVDSGADLRENTAILIGDPNGGAYELHIIETAPYLDPGVGKQITFTGEFDGKQLQNDWPASTPVYYTVPAWSGDLSESEAVFPVFYLSWGAPEPREDLSEYSPPTRDSYIRDTLDGNHMIGFRETTDTLRFPVEIHIYSSSVEAAVEMQRFLREVFDRRNFIRVAGWNIDYEIVSQRRLNISADVGQNLPHYIMQLSTYPFENSHRRIYRSFPALKVLTHKIVGVEYGVNIIP